MEVCSQLYNDCVANLAQSPKISVEFGIVNDTDPNWITFNRAAKEVTTIICDASRLNCSFTETLDGTYYVINNGTWGGFLGALSNETYNSTLPIFRYTKLREQYFSFSQPVLREFQYFITRKPSPYIDLFSWKPILAPFNWKVWLALLLATLAISILIWCYQKKFSNLLALCINISLLLIRKSQKFYRLNIAGNSLLNIWSVLAIVVTAYYTSGLLTSMIRVQSKPPFSDLDSLIDCLRTAKCRLIVNDKIHSWFLKEKPDRSDSFFVFNEIMKEHPPLYTDKLTDLYKKIESTEDIYLVTGATSASDSAVLLKEHNNFCSLILFEYYTDTFYLFRLNDPLVKSVNLGINLVERSGILAKIRQTVPQMKRCRLQDNLSESKKTSASPVQLRWISCAISVSSSGFLLAIVTLLCELLSKKLQSRPRNI